MKHLTIYQSGVNRFLKKRKYEKSSDYLCEIYGSFPGKATVISFNEISGYLVISGDDGGLSNDDILRLKELFNSGEKGHSEFGIGVRTSCAELTQQSDKDYFYVSDGNTTIKYFVDNNSEDFIKGYEDNNSENIYDKYNNCKIDTLYNKNEIKKKITKWIVPMPEFLKKDFEEECKFDILKRFSYPIKDNIIQIYYNDKKLEIETPFFSNNFENCKILNCKENGRGNAKYFYQINDKIYDKDKYTIVENKDLNIIDTVANFNMSYYNPKSDICDKITSEYGIKKTSYNGILILKHGVLLSTKFVLGQGQRNAGTNKDDHEIITIENIDSKEKIYTTNTEKNDAPKLENKLKEFIKVTRELKKKKKKIKDK
jgi:hypothetical protein